MSAETVLQLGFWVGAGHELAWAGEVLQDELDRVQPHPQTPRIIDCLAQFTPAMAVHVPGRNGRLGLVAGPAGTVFGVVIEAVSWASLQALPLAERSSAALARRSMRFVSKTTKAKTAITRFALKPRSQPPCPISFKPWPTPAKPLGINSATYSRKGSPSKSGRNRLVCSGRSSKLPFAT